MQPNSTNHPSGLFQLLLYSRVVGSVVCFQKKPFTLFSCQGSIPSPSPPAAARGSPKTRAPSSGGHSIVEPPGPIPNPEVKRSRANGSVVIGHVRVGRCQVIRKSRSRKGPAFCVFKPEAWFQAPVLRQSALASLVTHLPVWSNTRLVKASLGRFHFPGTTMSGRSFSSVFGPIPLILRRSSADW